MLHSLRIFLLVLVILSIVALVITAEWCYEGNCGPRKWKGKCKFGTSQSPVNIIPTKTTKSKPGRKLVFSKEYYEAHQFEMINNGHTVQLSLVPPADGSQPKSNLRVEGAGWVGQYSFLQMHFHWGSEHLVKNTRYPLELHIVHEQVNGNGGLGVLGILFAIKSNSKALSPIIKMLSQVQNVSQSPVKLSEVLNISNFLPKVWDVFRYEGSLTTPPCSEKILWSVFTQRMPISSSQVQAFKQLQDQHGKAITKNYRPPKLIVTKTRKYVYWMPVNKDKMIDAAFN